MVSIRFVREALCGSRCYLPGELAEVPDDVAKHHIAAGTAIAGDAAWESPAAPALPETPTPEGQGGVTPTPEGPGKKGKKPAE